MSGDERPYIVMLTPSQRLALIDVISSAIVGPVRMEKYIDVMRNTETRPEELLDLVVNAPQGREA